MADKKKKHIYKLIEIEKNKGLHSNKLKKFDEFIYINSFKRGLNRKKKLWCQIEKKIKNGTVD